MINDQLGLGGRWIGEILVGAFGSASNHNRFVYFGSSGVRIGKYIRAVADVILGQKEIAICTSCGF